MSEGSPSEFNPAVGLPSEDECRKAAKQYEEILMRIPAVHGVGVGDHCVNVYVSRVTPTGNSPPSDRIPEELGISNAKGEDISVPTRVIAQEPLQPEALEE
ncbi:hypothetical protein [Streptomyces sp. NPDC013457]|uniref:hypothetical protein n=1 Tax=Streptomyces sp. NPDC013457 TaxID=3364866 RepID=UPI0036FA5231